ncbi:MAG: hypothetical protein K6C10_08260 [Prevotella sp.]|nr:hypothetical protein [Prevotella sp.]
MKKVFILLIGLIGALGLHAEDYEYPYLTFETTDGEKISISVSSLTMTFSSSTLTAGTQYFNLANLSKMYFTTTDESTTTSIKEVSAADLDEATAIYDIQGRKVTKDQMQRGIYVIKTNKGTFKVSVK